jgi:hypothetical protein
MARPQHGHRSPRESLQPKHFRSREPKRWPEWLATWFPLIALITLLVLAPFWLVRLMGWLIAR